MGPYPYKIFLYTVLKPLYHKKFIEVLSIDLM